MEKQFLTQKQLEELAEHFWDDEIHGEGSYNEQDSDLSEAGSEHSNHDKHSELEETEAESHSEQDRGDIDSEVDLEMYKEESDQSKSEEDVVKYYYGKNRFKWAKSPPAPSRTRSSNIVSHLPGVKGPVHHSPPKTPIEAWSLLFSDDIIEEILEHTNAKITYLCLPYGNTASFVGHLDKVELREFLGLLILAGVLKSNHEDVRSLFKADSTGVMSKDSFCFLLFALRFDDQNTPEQRIKDSDKLAPISKIYDILNRNSQAQAQANYTCSENGVVDEMLVGFRDRCLFRQYVKSKPKKYGIKIMYFCDAKTHYLINSFVYKGKGSEMKDKRPKLSTAKLLIPIFSVLKLVSPVMGTNRNITGGNWFSSIELMNELKNVGTLRKNKKDIPLQFLPNRTKQPLSSSFGFIRDYTMTTFVPKRSVDFFDAPQ